MPKPSGWPLAVGGPLAIAAVAVALGAQPAEQFGEGKLGTWASCLLLLSSATLAFDTWRARRPARGALLWLLIASGFVYLALDDAFSWHEKLDRFLHRKVLGIVPTDVTTSLDDLIIGAYGLVALALLYRFRDEIRRVPTLMRLLAIAMGLMFLQVAIDVIDHEAVLRALAEKGPNRQLLRLWVPVAEETVKLVAEGVFVLAFARAWRYARRRS